MTDHRRHRCPRPTASCVDGRRAENGRFAEGDVRQRAIGNAGSPCGDQGPILVGQMGRVREHRVLAEQPVAVESARVGPAAPVEHVAVLPVALGAVGLDAGARLGGDSPSPTSAASVQAGTNLGVTIGSTSPSGSESERIASMDRALASTAAAGNGQRYHSGVPSG